jgi:DNA invertase Pin-like site-specific DNA recombinase
MAAKKDPREARARELLAKGRSRDEVAHELELTVTQLWAITAKPDTEKQRANQRKVLERLRREA